MQGKQKSSGCVQGNQRDVNSGVTESPLGNTKHFGKLQIVGSKLKTKNN